MSRRRAMMAQSGVIPISSWADIKRACEGGHADRVFTVGEQLTCTRTTAVSGITETLVWDIVNVKPSEIVLLLHDAFENIAFGAPQALYYAEGGLAAGTYSFAYDGTNPARFTLTESVPAGGQVVLSWTSGDITAANIFTYASSTSMAAIESNIAVSEGSNGVQLTTVNDISRARYGSNNYANSAIRQWLNSEEAAGEVWTPKTNYDRPPSWASTEAGFANGLDADFLAAVSTSGVVTAKNTVSDGGGSVTLCDKFFLPSRFEMYTGKENGISEGEEWGIYNTLSANPITGNCQERVKSLTETPCSYWLRTPRSTGTERVRSISPSGALNHNNAYNAAYGAAPACKIS